MIDSIVRKNYLGRVEKHIKSEEITSFIKNHPALEKCMGELITNIRKVELSHATFLDFDTIKALAEDFGYMFAKAILNKKEHDIKTESERIRLQREYDELERIKKATDPMAVDIDDN